MDRDEKDIVGLAEQLKKHVDGAKSLDSEVVLDILRALEKKTITKSILEKTKIGLLIHECRKSENPKVVEKSKLLRQKWKDSVQAAPHGSDSTAKSEASPKVESRTSSSSGESSELLRKYETSVPIRDKSMKLFFEGLLLAADGDEHTAAKLASEIENEIFNQNGHATEAGYKAKIRSVSFNLKDAANPKLRERVMQKEITPAFLAGASAEDLASEEKKKKTEEYRQKTINDTKVSASGSGARTTEFKCGKCGKRDTVYSQAQTRSADEPMTTFVTCMNCGNKWKFS